MTRQRKASRLSPMELCPPILDRPPTTDLRSISRNSNQCETVVHLQVNWDRSNDVRWLVLGAASVSKSGGDGSWRLEARFCDSVTDFEHSSAYVLRLPLVGLQMANLGVYNHQVYLVAWVDPNDPEGFNVPSPGYDPRNEDGAYLCTHKECVRTEKGVVSHGHVIVPEGFYVPPFNADLYRMVRGKKVEIRMGPLFKDDDEE